MDFFRLGKLIFAALSFGQKCVVFPWKIPFQCSFLFGQPKTTVRTLVFPFYAYYNRTTTAAAAAAAAVAAAAAAAEVIAAAVTI